MAFGRTELIAYIISMASQKGIDTTNLKEKLSAMTDEELNIELTKLLSNSTDFSVNKSPFTPTSTGMFSSGFVNQNDGIVVERNYSSTYASQQEYEAAKYVREYLFDAAKSAKKSYFEYKQDMGVFDVTWHILKPFANLFSDKGTITLSEMDKIIDKTYTDAQNIYNADNKGKFEFALEKSRGVRFDATKVEDFKTKSEEYMTVLAYKDKYNELEKGIKELKQIFSREKALNAQKAAGAMVMPSAYPQIASDAKFAQIIDDFCDGNSEVKEKFMAAAAQNVTSKDDFEKNFVQILENLQGEAKKSYEEKLNGRSFDEYKSDYEKAFSETFGGENAKELTDAWILNQKQGTAFVKMSADIAATMLLGGSNLVARGSTALAAKVGTTAAQQIVKTGVTTFGVAADGAFEAINAATSSTGLTKEKSEQIMNNMLDMAPYAFFGAFVSGPMGDFVQKAVSSSSSSAMPKILEKAFNTSAKGVGMAAEVSADAFFTNLLTDGDMLEALKGNAQGETQVRVLNKFMSMLVGGSANKATMKAFQDAMKDTGLDGYKVRKSDNGYELVSPSGVATNIGVGIKSAADTTAKIPANGLGENIFSAKTNKTPDTDASVETAKKLGDETAQNNEPVQQKTVMDDAQFEKMKEDLAQQLFADKDFPKEEIRYVIKYTNKDNIDFTKQLCADKDFPKVQISAILESTNKDNIDFAKQLCADKDFPKVQIISVLASITKDNIDFAKQLYADKEFPKEQISSVLYYTNKDNIDLAKQLCADKDFPKDAIWTILQNPDSQNIDLAKQLYADKEFPKEQISSVLYYTNKDNIDLAKQLCTDKNFNIFEIKYILDKTTKDNIDFAKQLCADKDFPKEQISAVLESTNKDNIELAKIICSDKDFPKYEILYILERTGETNTELAKIMCADKDFPKDKIRSILERTDKINIELAKIICADKDFPKEDIAEILRRTNESNIEYKKEIYNLLKSDKDFPQEKIDDVLLYTTNKDKMDLAKQLCTDKDFPKEKISDVLHYTNTDNIDFVKNLCQNYKKLEIDPKHISLLLNEQNNISPKQLQKLRHKMGRENLGKLSQADIVIAAKLVDIYGKNSINEISIAGKKELLKSLVGSNTELFKTSDEMKKMFPLLPTDKETYCSLLPSIVKSIGVDIRTIEPPERIEEFNKNLDGLSKSLAKISDSDFASLDIKMDYTKEDFIKNVLEKVKGLSENERQKVYDYFGFELHHNKNNPTGFSITGYPINLNNGKKLAEITDPATKAVVENLRPDVVRFSENNSVKCSSPELQELLNQVVDVMPELRTQIGKVQHKTQDYDAFKHSLKVMQKVAQDPKFDTLNESDKKIMLLASLLHDVTKAEGYSDKTHAKQGSFDTFFISKKFNLTKEEEIKLYTLTRHHEWLEYANTAKSEEELTKRLQSIAYDLQNDNLFDMALMFTHADLKAVKADDSFHDTTIGDSRVSFDGTVRSYGQAADVYAERIKDYVKELQKSQPVLPVTKVPSAARISDAITTVNPDGSTNIKGVYKDKDGLVVIKFNEVDDWEAIGFPKGSVSRGITAKGVDNRGNETNVDTGNIKFFVHGLDYENQLSKFDAFSLIDSDALLSISYTERPESKYRFFRPQGVILDFDTKYVHGGGNTDSGSGCGKSIDNFKENYIFGGLRESDRVYVSDLIKNATGMDDAQYVQFVKENANKSFTEIEPAELRDKIIKALATINSNTRKGNREYNEMYGSNPDKVMGVFAYNIDYNETIGNPIAFLNRTELGQHEKGYNGAGKQSVYERTEFLRRYALEHNVPFIVFGD